MLDFPLRLGTFGLNHLLNAEPWARERLRAHSGAHLLIEAGIFKAALCIDELGTLSVANADSQPDVKVLIPAEAIFNGVLDPQRMFSAIKLEGAADVAESFAFVFRNLRWDVESDLAKVVGDIAARRLNLAGQSLAKSLRLAVRNAAGNIGEYAIHDGAMIASKEQLQDFGSSIATLRDDVARLEKRISGL